MKCKILPRRHAVHTLIAGVTLAMLGCGAKAQESLEEEVGKGIQALDDPQAAVNAKQILLGDTVTGAATAPVAALPLLSGYYQPFANGVIVVTDDTSAFLSKAIFDRWIATKTELTTDGLTLLLYLGPPITDVTNSANPEVHFLRGRMIVDSTGTIRTIYGAMEEKYKASFATLGLPVSDSVSTADGGSHQSFALGELYAKPGSDAYVVQHGKVHDRWVALGATGSILGYPTADTLAASGIYTGRFEGGAIYAGDNTNAVELVTPLLTAYERLGGPSEWLKMPIESGVSGAGDQFVDFQGGVLVLHNGEVKAFGTLKAHVEHAWGYGDDWECWVWDGSQDLYVRVSVASSDGTVVSEKQYGDGDSSDLSIGTDWPLTTVANHNFWVEISVNAMDKDTCSSDDWLGTATERYSIDNLWGAADSTDEHSAQNDGGSMKATFSVKNEYHCQDGDFRKCQAWSFANHGTDNLDWDTYAAAFSDVDADENHYRHPINWLYYSWFFDSIAEDGNCYGLSLETINAQLGRSPYGEPIHQYPETPAIMSYINMKQGYQLGMSQVEWFLESYVTGRTHNPIQSYLEGEAKFDEGDYPVITLFDGYFFGGTHTVRPYRWDDSTLRIYIYDSNVPMGDTDTRPEEYIQLSLESLNRSSFSYDKWSGGTWLGGRMLETPTNDLLGQQITPLGALDPFQLIHDGIVWLSGSTAQVNQVTDGQGRTLFKPELGRPGAKWDDLQGPAVGIPNFAPIPVALHSGQLFAGRSMTGVTQKYDVLGNNEGTPYEVGVSTASLSSHLVIPATQGKPDSITMANINTPQKSVKLKVPSDGVPKAISWTVSAVDKCTWTTFDDMIVEPGQEISMHLDQGGLRVVVENDGAPTSAVVSVHKCTAPPIEGTRVPVPNGTTQVGLQPPVARCHDVKVTADPNSCAVAASIDYGSISPMGSALSLEQSPTGPFGVGTTPVTLTVTDKASGLASSCNANVIVTDTTLPIFDTKPTDIVAAPPCTPDVNLITPTASDNCGGTVQVTSDAPAKFPVGVTTVTWRATDASGNVATHQQKVTVSPSVDFDKEHTVVNVTNNACLRVTKYPSWGSYMHSLVIQPQATGVGFPIPFTYTNCGSNGSGSLPGPWLQGTTKPVSASCPTLIRLGGNGSGSVALTWWGNG